MLRNKTCKKGWPGLFRFSLGVSSLNFLVVLALLLSLLMQFLSGPLPASAASCDTTFTHTYEVQGTTDISPLSGKTVTVQGVVVGDNEGPSPTLRGFFLQDETGDGDPVTSDGLFVFNNNNNSVSVGQVVRVTGAISEFQGQTQLSLSATAPLIQDCGRTATITPTDVTLPVPSTTYLERYEGMLVRLPQTLYVTESFQLGRFDQLVMSSGDRLRQPTELAAPGAPAQAIQAANDLNRIIIDDNLQNQNPDPIIFGRGTSPLSASNTLRMGDSATGIVGILNYTWAGNGASPNAYRVRPTNQPNFVASNPRPAAPENVGGTLRVVSANVLNYFNTFTGCTFGFNGAPADCRGAENQTEFDRQTAKTVAALVSMQADIITLSEIENDGYGPDSAIAYLVDRLNAATAPGTYAFIDADAGTGQVNALGLDAIKVGMLYKPAKVTLIGNTAALNTGALGLFTLANGTQQGRSRPALAQSFEQVSNGERFTIVANHLKSKSSACTDNVSPVGPDPDTGDLQGNCNLTRKQAALEEVNWLTTNPTGIADPDILIMGDMNSYAQEDPITAFKNGGYINVIEQRIGSTAYSYVFNGQSGYLDHSLVSPTLNAQVAGITEYHNNADEPTVLDYNTNFKSAGQVQSLYAPDQYRASDHDPVVIGLNLHPIAKANSDSYTAEAGSTLNVTAAQGVLANDAGGPLSIVSNTNPAHGSLTLNADGSFSYTPVAGYTGSDSFSYSVKNADDYNYTSTAKVTISVVDTTKPTVNIISPLEGAVFLLDQVVAASYSCSDNPGGSGLASCTGPVPSGSNINTASAGNQSFTVTAVDNAGNLASATRTYVVYAPRDYIQWVRNNVTALRATVTNNSDRNQLDAIIKNLDKALDPALWIDASHPVPGKGGKIFELLAAVVGQLQNLQNDTRSTISDAILQTFINQLDSTARELASIAIREANTRGANTASAQAELVNGDTDLAAGSYVSAITHYSNAWNQALKAQP